MGYRLRWAIEIFHKHIKMFLGFEDVATKWFEAVESHVHWVYCAYIVDSEIHKIGYFPPSENVHQLTPVNGVRETAKCSFMDKLPWIFIPRLLILWHKP
ncbi:MAG: hypothetical protein B6I30_00770 [Desulfobacteraceae bacterium 4572_187]|nr:MAG: hypothetical protein B6I30_00770 [Desulfobacteraceae bacterium 4572_187]